MHQHAAATGEPVADEGVAGGHELQQVLVLVVVDLDHMVPVRREHGLVQRLPHRRHHVRDLGRAEGVIAPEREQAAARSGAMQRACVARGGGTKDGRSRIHTDIPSDVELGLARDAV